MFNALLSRSIGRRSARRMHGSIVAPFDLPLSVDTAAPTTEPRLGPNTTIVFTFDKPVVGAVATILEGVAAIGPVLRHHRCVSDSVG